MILYRPITRGHKIRAIEQEFENRLGRKLNLNAPQTLSEKIQWLKLNYNNPLVTLGADKVAGREFVAKQIGVEYLIPLIGVYRDARDIDWAQLPKQFVAKINNGCGLNIICIDKYKMNQHEVINKLNSWLKPVYNHYWRNYEWGYKKIRSRILIEQYIGDENNQINEYKFMYFNGKLAFIQVPTDRKLDDQFSVKLTFFDKDWNRLPFKRESNPVSEVDIPRPKRFIEMLKASKKLASGFPICRVDFYEVGGEVKFGELTFTPSNGLARFEPEGWDLKLGKMLQLPRRNNFTFLEWRPVEMHSLRYLMAIIRRKTVCGLKKIIGR